MKTTTKKICTSEGCQNIAQKAGKCSKHANLLKQCSEEGCNNFAQKGGVCMRHGAERKRCTKDGCNNFAQKGGVCGRHGAKRKRCKVPKCTNQAKDGSVCIRHGAKTKICASHGCTNQAKRKGLCVRHSKETNLTQPDTGQGGNENRKEGAHNMQNKKFTQEAIYHEHQELELCGKHALNAALQYPGADRKLMNEVGGEIVALLKSLKQGEKNYLFHKTNGNYNRDVVEAAANRFGLRLENVDSDDPDKLMNHKGEQAYIVHTTDRGEFHHYYTIRLINGEYWNLDSLLQWPVKITLNEITKCMDDHLDSKKRLIMRKVILEDSYCETHNERLGENPSVSASDPCVFDRTEKGHWWSLHYLEHLIQDQSTLNVTMSLSGDEPMTQEFQMESTQTLLDCFNRFKGAFNARGLRENKVTLYLGEEVIDTKRWKRFPVKLIGSKGIRFSVWVRGAKM